jgi:DNA-binding MarR family transcriptional regulator
VPTPLQLAAVRAASLAVGDCDPRLSRSLLRGLSLLAGFGGDSPERGIVELAHELHMSPATAHRYARTLVALELLEHSPTTRRYRLRGVSCDDCCEVDARWLSSADASCSRSGAR